MSGWEVFLCYVLAAFSQTIVLYIFGKVGYFDDTAYEDNVPQTPGEMIFYTLFFPFVFIFYAFGYVYLFFKLLKFLLDSLLFLIIKRR